MLNIINEYYLLILSEYIISKYFLLIIEIKFKVRVRLTVNNGIVNLSSKSNCEFNTIISY